MREMSQVPEKLCTVLMLVQVAMQPRSKLWYQ